MFRPISASSGHGRSPSTSQISIAVLAATGVLAFIVLGQGVPPLEVFFLAGVIAAQGIHILALYVPFLQEVLQVQPVSLVEWLVLLALASSVVIVMEIFKAVRNHRPPGHQTGTGVGEAPHR